MLYIQNALAKRADEDEGFTLIELLVVVIIIGILAAIAIPVFLNQREKAWDASSKSDLKNAATAEETAYTDDGVYTAIVSDADASTTDLASVGFNSSAQVTTDVVVSSDGQSYCLATRHAANQTNVWYLSSDGGSPKLAADLVSGEFCETAANRPDFA